MNKQNTYLQELRLEERNLRQLKNEENTLKQLRFEHLQKLRLEQLKKIN